jgi:hypothetical protein
MDPRDAYQRSMQLIRARFTTIESAFSIENDMVRSEQIALQVRKIIEALAYCSLSASEKVNNTILRDQRSKDADKLLNWLDAKNILRLPAAQIFRESNIPSIKVIIEGAPEKNWTKDRLLQAFSRASAQIHQKHPEDLTNRYLAAAVAEIEKDARELREWLWKHTMDLRGEAFLVQMKFENPEHFLVSIRKVSDIPPEMMAASK